jgi:hypothetical protein
MTLKVIGAGFGRTGTLSLKLALEQLGFNKCHHMIEVFQDEQQQQYWHDAAFGKTMNWDDVFEGFAASVDFPSCAYYEQLMAYYPEAKVVLSLRDPDSWFASATNTIFNSMDKSADSDSIQSQMVTKLILQDTFGGKHRDAEHAKAVFNAHNEKVQSVVPKDRLLVFEAKMGWAPLCEFLGVSVPDTDYPRTNSTDEFNAMFPLKSE